MSFIKRTIKDRVATGDNKFTNSGDATDLVLTPNPDSVTEAGTPVNADLLQRYENGLYAVGNNLDGGKASGVDANNNHSAGVMGSKITMRSDTASNWSSINPVLAKGEYGFDETNKVIKIGDGSTAWNSLPPINATASSTDFTNRSWQTYNVSSITGHTLASIGMEIGKTYEIAFYNEAGSHSDRYRNSLGVATIIVPSRTSVEANASLTISGFYWTSDGMYTRAKAGILVMEIYQTSNGYSVTFTDYQIGGNASYPTGTLYFREIK